MKYVILMQSSPQPWGHPTAAFLPEQQALSPEERAQSDQWFDDMLTQMTERGELLDSAPLGDPATSRLFRWRDGERVITDGPYAEGKEHLAGYFLIDVESQERAEEIATAFSGPGETVELRPVMGGGGDAG